MAPQRPLYLVRRGDAFYFRRALPGRLINRFDRAEIKVSLYTDDPGQARMQCRELSNRFEQLISLVLDMPELTAKAIDNLIGEYFAKGLHHFQETLELSGGDPQSGFDVDRERTYAEAQLPALKHSIVKREYDATVQAEAVKLVEGSGYDLPSATSERWDNLCHGLLRARAEQYRIFSAMLDGNYDDVEPKDPLFKPAVTSALGHSGSISSGPGETVGELVKKYINEHSGEHGWVRKTMLDNRRVLNWFMELVKADKPITSITKVHIEQYRDLMTSLPSNYAKDAKFQGMGVVEAANLDVGHPQVSGATAKKYFLMLRAFLNWCEDMEFIDKVPGKKINVVNPTAGTTKRQPFNNKQLQAFFQSPVYTGSFSKSSRSRAGSVILRDGKFWIPLIALFSGMRLGEIVQMHVSDIKEVAGVQCFEVITMPKDEAELTDEDIAKKVKTPQSERRVPIHAELIRIGFNDYLAKRKQMKVSSKRLFPDIKPGKDNYYSHNFSKWFSRYAKDVGVKKGKQHVFHSFRHNFKSALYGEGVDESHQDALMGHLDKTQPKNTYISSEALVKAVSADMKKVHYDLDLSHLHLKNSKPKVQAKEGEGSLC